MNFLVDDLQKKQFFKIYNQRLAGFLMSNGFPLLQLVPNWRTGKNCFIFHNSAALRDYIDRWQIERIKL